MNSDLFFEGKKFISSSRAAQISGYANDYIGQLCRGGKLDCRMVGRSWYVSFDSLQEHRKLNVLASKNRNKNSPILVVKNLQDEKDEVVEYKGSSVSEGLPKLQPVPERVAVISQVHKIPIVVREEIPSEIIIPVKENTQHRKFAIYFPRLVAGTIALLISIAGFQASLSLNKKTEIAYQNFGNEIINSITHVTEISGEKLSASIFSSVGDSLNGVAKGFYLAVNEILFDTRTTILVMLGGEEATKTQLKLDAEPANEQDGQGMVVVPVDEKTDKDAVVAKIQNSFSDEVQVAPRADGTSGVITPVFKKVSNDEYLYVLVPIKN